MRCARLGFAESSTKSVMSIKNCLSRLTFISSLSTTCSSIILCHVYRLGMGQQFSHQAGMIYLSCFICSACLSFFYRRLTLKHRDEYPGPVKVNKIHSTMSSHHVRLAQMRSDHWTEVYINQKPEFTIHRKPHCYVKAIKITFFFISSWWLFGFGLD